MCENIPIGICEYRGDAVPRKTVSIRSVLFTAAATASLAYVLLNGAMLLFMTRYWMNAPGLEYTLREEEYCVCIVFMSEERNCLYAMSTSPDSIAAARAVALV